MNLLDGSPDLWVHPVELTYLTPVADLAAKGRVSKATTQIAGAKKQLDLPRDLRTALLLPQFGSHLTDTEALVRSVGGQPAASARTLLGLIAARDTNSTAEFLATLLDSSAAIGGGIRRMVAFKSVETAYVDEYAKVFPSMRFVHII